MAQTHGKGAIYRNDDQSPCFYVLEGNTNMEPAHQLLFNSYDSDREIMIIQACGKGSTSTLLKRSEATKIKIKVDKLTFHESRILR